MPNIGQQFESPGEKKDKPEKADRDIDTAGEVPESVKEGKDTLSELEEEFEPLDKEFKRDFNKALNTIESVWRDIVDNDYSNAELKENISQLKKQLNSMGEAGQEALEVIKPMLKKPENEWKKAFKKGVEEKNFEGERDAATLPRLASLVCRDGRFEVSLDRKYYRMKTLPDIPEPGLIAVSLANSSLGSAVAWKEYYKAKKRKCEQKGEHEKAEQIELPQILIAEWTSTFTNYLDNKGRLKVFGSRMHEWFEGRIEKGVSFDGLIEDPPENLREIVYKDTDISEDERVSKEELLDWFRGYCYHIKDFTEKFEKISLNDKNTVQLLDDFYSSGRTYNLAKDLIKLAIKKYCKDNDAQNLEVFKDKMLKVQIRGPSKFPGFSTAKQERVTEKGQDFSINYLFFGRYDQNSWEYWESRMKLDFAKRIGWVTAGMNDQYD